MDGQWLIFCVVLLTSTYCVSSSSASGHGLCGQAKHDTKKTCISVRLPWKAEPIYFCTEKENVKYEKKCPESHKCLQTQWSNITLLIATPWDCCPIASKPSNCENVFCPPKPHNRTCVTLKKRYLGGCCPSYFCEETADPEETCNFKALEPSCHAPPKDKTKCIGFVDHYGCCTKYQCEGEGKPGTCPAHYQIPPNGYVANPRNVGQANLYDRQMNMQDHPAINNVLRKQLLLAKHFTHQSLHCIGDWNCPGDMKCCPVAYSVSYGVYPTRDSSASSFYTTPTPTTEPDGDSNSIFYDSRATYGYCTHPAKKGHGRGSGRNKNKRPITPSPEKTEDHTEDHTEEDAEQ